MQWRHCVWQPGKAYPQNVFSECLASIVQYFKSCLHSLLCDNVVAGHPGWTNNNCESVNHAIKQYTQWRPQQLPDLIKKLWDLVCGQYTEADWELCGHGGLQLVPTYAKHRMTIDSWKSMSAAQRQKATSVSDRPLLYRLWVNSLIIFHLLLNLFSWTIIQIGLGTWKDNLCG